MKSSCHRYTAPLLLILLTSSGVAQTTVVGWGRQIFDSSWAEETGYVEIAAGVEHTVARRSDGSIVAGGADGEGQCSVPALPPGRSYVEITAAFERTVARVCATSACNPLTLAVTQDTTTGCGPVVIAVAGATPWNELYNLVSLSCINGSGLLFGIGLDAWDQVFKPLGSHPFHVLADAEGEYHLSIATSCSLNVTIEAVTVEILPGTHLIMNVSPTTGCVNLSL